MVERVKADTDGRAHLAVLTPAGFARLEQAYPIHLAGVRKHVMDHLAGLETGHVGGVQSRHGKPCAKE